MSGNYILHNFSLSSCSWRVRIALYLKNISYQYIPVNILSKEKPNLSPEFKKINPTNKIPVLTLPDGRRIHQSLAIIDYLENAYPKQSASLYPSDLYLRAHSFKVAHMLVSDVQPLQNAAVLAHINRLVKTETHTSAKTPADTATKPTPAEEWARFYISKGLTSLEEDIRSLRKELGLSDLASLSQQHVSTEAPFTVGEQLSLADLCLVPQMANAKRFNMDLTPYPTLTIISRHLMKLPSFAETQPSRMVDKPADASDITF